jgi:hypothetical protein
LETKSFNKIDDDSFKKVRQEKFVHRSVVRDLKLASEAVAFWTCREDLKGEGVTKIKIT